MTSPDKDWSLRTDQSFFQQAQRRSTRYFIVYFVPHSSFESTVIVPKTMAHLATDRNKLKRQVRAILAKQPATSKVKLAVVALRPATTATFAELKADLTQALAKL